MYGPRFLVDIWNSLEKSLYLLFAPLARYSACVGTWTHAHPTFTEPGDKNGIALCVCVRAYPSESDDWCPRVALFEMGLTRILPSKSCYSVRELLYLRRTMAMVTRVNVTTHLPLQEERLVLLGILFLH